MVSDCTRCGVEVLQVYGMRLRNASVPLAIAVP